MKKALIILLAVIFCLSGCTVGADGISKEQYDTLASDLEALQSQYEQLQKTFDEAKVTSKEEYEELSTTYNALKEQYDTLFAANAELQEKHDTLTADNGTLQGEYDTLLAEYTALAEQFAELYALFETLFGGSETPPDDTTDPFDEALVLSQLETTEYSCSSMFFEYAFLAIKNNSEYDLEISVAAKFYNEAGELIGAKNDSQPAFESGTETLFWFVLDEPYATVEYEYTVSEEDYFKCIVSSLSYEAVSAKEKEIISVTNNSDKDAEFVEGQILFFAGDTVVGYEYTYFTDNDSELKAGKTITKEMECYEEYDSFKIFITGRQA